MVLTSYIALNRIAASPISGKADRDESLGPLNYGQHTIGSAEVDASVSFVMPGFLGGAFLECVFGVDNFKRSSKPALLNSRAKTAFSYKHPYPASLFVRFWLEF